jgi:phage shock protein C
MTENDYRPQGNRAPKRLMRVQKDRKIAGVCTGFGDYFNVDPVIFRLVFLGLVVAGGAGILIYLIAWIIMPLDETP